MVNPALITAEETTRERPDFKKSFLNIRETLGGKYILSGKRPFIMKAMLLSGKRLSGKRLVRESSVREMSCPGNDRLPLSVKMP